MGKKKYSSIMCEWKGKKEEVLWITFKNERMLNAMTDVLQQEFLEVLEAARFDNSIRCVVITGSGEKAFSAGGDISYFLTLDKLKAYDFLYERGNRVQHAITYMEKPVIGAVNGYCFAGGMEVALCCDFVYASKNARFGLTEIDIGLLPGWGGTVRLPRNILVRHAKEMIFKGGRITADEAYRVGLVNKVFDTIPELYEGVEECVSIMMSKPPLSLRMAKNIINNSITCGSMEAALAIERGAFTWLFSSDDMKEGVNAFQEKRKPVFKGK
ncbi:MAG: enoyl-CoA hydratase/isomerase family protein [Dehalococcoidales bacterium]|nr:enoyl-CoA hydratase/isomerase family protein [Dehalococcoidales bacterium]